MNQRVSGSASASGIVALALLGAAGCDALLIDNPANCVRNPSLCSSDERCNEVTRRCETLDCTVNTTLCTTTQSCSATTHRCQTSAFVLGQPDADSNFNAAYGMASAWSVALTPNPSDPTRTRLVVADQGNGRVLIWNSVPTEARPADLVLGMPNVNTLSVRTSYDGPKEYSLLNPWSVCATGDTVIVGDQGWSRVLVFSQLIRLAAGPPPLPASTLWGQATFDLQGPNSGMMGTNALGLTAPSVFAESPPNSAFYIADAGNHRVLGFPGIPSSPSQAPAAVLGQADLVTGLGGTTDSKLNSPNGVYSDGSQLYVADTFNHRVVSFNLPLATGQAATGVWGQADLMSGLANRGGPPGASTLQAPGTVARIDIGARRLLLVADTQNHRVLGFDLPALSANLVLGQGDFGSVAQNRGGPVGPATLSFPSGVASDGQRLVVGDNGNHRVLIWNSVPKPGDNGRPADVVLGQPDASSRGTNLPPLLGPLQFQGPSDVATDGQRLAVADTGNNRVLLWLTLPRDGNSAPDLVLGQADFQSRAPNRGQATVSAGTVNAPFAVAFSGGTLAVADTGSHRVLIWNRLPAQSGAAANVVLGQLDFVTAAPTVGPRRMTQPFALAFSGQGGLFVADLGNSRVLRFDPPFITGQAASLVLGQAGFVTGTANAGGRSAASLAGPRALSIDGSRLAIADGGNSRVLVFNTLPTINNQPADVVVGQADFTTAYTRVDRSHCDSPAGVRLKDGRLYVSSYLQNRILYWNQVPMQNGVRADGVLGQTDFLSELPGNPDVPAIERLSGPVGIAAAADQLYIADAANHRVVVRPAP